MAVMERWVMGSGGFCSCCGCLSYTSYTSDITCARQPHSRGLFLSPPTPSPPPPSSQPPTTRITSTTTTTTATTATITSFLFRPVSHLTRGQIVCCLTAWSSGCLAVWLPGCLAVWLSGCLGVSPSGCLDVWMFWLPGCISFMDLQHTSVIHDMVTRWEMRWLM